MYKFFKTYLLYNFLFMTNMQFVKLNEVELFKRKDDFKKTTVCSYDFDSKGTLKRNIQISQEKLIYDKKNNQTVLKKSSITLWVNDFKDMINTFE